MLPIPRKARVVAVSLLLLLAAPPCFGAAALDEDVDFGCGLVKQRFYRLGIDVLKAREPELAEERLVPARPLGESLRPPGGENEVRPPM